MRTVLEAYKIYRTITTICNRNIAWEEAAPISPASSDNIYKLAVIAFEVGGFFTMTGMFYYMRRTIETFNKNEFDLIRNNFTTDFYKLQRDHDNE